MNRYECFFETMNNIRIYIFRKTVSIFTGRMIEYSMYNAPKYNRTLKCLADDITYIRSDQQNCFFGWINVNTCMCCMQYELLWSYVRDIESMFCRCFYSSLFLIIIFIMFMVRCTCCTFASNSIMFVRQSLLKSINCINYHLKYNYSPRNSRIMNLFLPFAFAHVAVFFSVFSSRFSGVNEMHSNCN